MDSEGGQTHDAEAAEDDRGRVRLIPGEELSVTAAALADQYWSSWQDYVALGQAESTADALTDFLAKTRALALQYGRYSKGTQAHDVVIDHDGRAELLPGGSFADTVELLRREMTMRGDFGAPEDISIHAGLVVNFLAHRRTEAAQRLSREGAPLRVSVTSVHVGVQTRSDALSVTLNSWSPSLWGERQSYLALSQRLIAAGVELGGSPPADLVPWLHGLGIPQAELEEHGQRAIYAELFAVRDLVIVLPQTFRAPVVKAFYDAFYDDQLHRDPGKPLQEAGRALEAVIGNDPRYLLPYMPLLAADVRSDMRHQQYTGLTTQAALSAQTSAEHIAADPDLPVSAVLRGVRHILPVLAANPDDPRWSAAMTVACDLVGREHPRPAAAMRRAMHPDRFDPKKPQQVLRAAADVWKRQLVRSTPSTPTATTLKRRAEQRPQPHRPAQ